MKVTKSRTKRLFPRSKFSLLNAEFLVEESKKAKEGNNCSWNRLRDGKSVEIDSKALLEGNGLKVPNGHSVTTFIEQELGVDVVKSTNNEDEIVGAKKEDESEEETSQEMSRLLERSEDKESEPESPEPKETKNKTKGVED